MFHFEYHTADRRVISVLLREPTKEPSNRKCLSFTRLRMRPDLEYVLANGKSRFESYDEPRLAYLKEHGITVYGALVTGPVRELEKLQRDPEFHEFRLGRIEVWNW